ncbi:hypothetical protein UFOVP103_13 [uncultured Caudovirales phage]|uniref:Uncharacterized protein n=1 Tax=uncultured Caudovirales phage TaxID=2100421 RepID=A0A6J5KZU0_9CAUD|nr:hypothetical protein UFOVP103_13 [uncultured Caudovirales phage]CAB5217035.1 hypothetical protein UFOVP197_42 [uncultured Caudovirales phage]
MDWSQVGQYGIGGMSLFILAYVLKMHYESYQANTNALSELKIVIQKQSDREQLFMDMIYPIAKDTNERIRIIETMVKQ